MFSALRKVFRPNAHARRVLSGLCAAFVLATDFYDYFTEAQRKAYDKFNGFVAVAGCRLAVEF